MWSKDEQQDQASSPTPSSAPRRGNEQTRIGSSVALEGTLKCEEDLRLEGKLKGTVSVPNPRVVIGTSGRIRANVQARITFSLIRWAGIFLCGWRRNETCQLRRLY